MPAGTAAQGSTDPKASLQATNAKSLELNERGVAAQKAKDYKTAEDLFHKAMTTDRYNITAVFNLAGIYLITQKEAKAVSLLESYTSQYKNDAGLFVRLGDAYFASKRIPDALKAYESAYKLAPKYLGLASKMATLYGLLNRLPEAEQMLRQAAEQEPKNGKLLGNLSAALLANKKADEAIVYAKRSLQIKPDKEVYITLGAAYESKGDTKNAVIAYQRAVDLGDQRKELKQKIEALNKLPS
jgi:predicted Zn-dependent protease